MSTTEDTSAIDDKKAEDTGSSNTYDFSGFIKNYISSIVVTIGFSIFFVGTLGLYTTKIAQANILPDNIDLAPYTIFDRIVKEMPVDINITRPSMMADSKDIISQKAVFNSKEYLDSFDKSFLCYIKKNADPNAGLFANAPLFFSNVYDNIVAKNFLAINSIFFYLSYLPESLIMLLYGIFGIFIWVLLYFFNVCISIFYHIINIPQLFRSTSETVEGHWETEEQISFLRLGKLLLFFFIWLPVGFFSTLLTPLFFTFYSLIAPLSATYNIQKTNKKYGFLDFIKDTFIYKKSFFMLLASLSLISNGIKYLGTNSLIGIIIGIIIAYILGFYSNNIQEPGVYGFTPRIRVNMKQAPIESIDASKPQLVEVCSQIPIDNAKIKEKIKLGKFRSKSNLNKNVDDLDDMNGGDSINLNTNSNVMNNNPTNNNPINNNPINNNPIQNNQMGGKKTKKYNIRLVY